MIPRVLEQVDPSAMAYLMNAIYFKSRWKNPFPAAAVSTGVMTTSVPQYAAFHADHPFLYLITESSTGAILFAGKFTGQ